MTYIMIIWLVVTGTWLDYDFPETVGNGIMIPIDFHSIIFQRGRSTTNQLSIYL